MEKNMRKFFFGPNKCLEEKNWVNKIRVKKFGVEIYFLKNFVVQKDLWPKKFRVKKILVKFFWIEIIYCGSLTLKFQAILFARSCVMGFVSVEEKEERVVLFKINEMVLKVPSHSINEIVHISVRCFPI